MEEPSSREEDNTSPFKKKQEDGARMKIRTHDSAKRTDHSGGRCTSEAKLNTISTHPQPTESLVHLQRGRHL